MSDLATEYGMAKSVLSTILKHKEALRGLGGVEAGWKEAKLGN